MLYFLYPLPFFTDIKQKYVLLNLDWPLSQTLTKNCLTSCYQNSSSIGLPPEYSLKNHVAFDKDPASFKKILVLQCNLVSDTRFLIMYIYSMNLVVNKPFFSYSHFIVLSILISTYIPRQIIPNNFLLLLMVYIRNLSQAPPLVYPLTISVRLH